MPVELRKRKAPAAPPVPAPAAKKSSSRGSAKPAQDSKVKAPPADTNKGSKSSASKAPKVGETIALDGFGGSIETNDGEATSLKALVNASKAGVVLLAYPKASTPGCTTQVCLARDSFDELTRTGLDVFGISRDSPKANTTFKTKQSLPFPLLCDKDATLIGAIGLKKAPSGTSRGVFVVDRSGKVLAAQQASPKDSIEVVKALVGSANAAVDDKAEGEEKAAEEKRGDEKEAKDE